MHTGGNDAKVPRNSSEAAKLLGRWDLGSKRSLNQLIQFTGIDTRNYKTEFDNCGKRQWVPFDEGDDDDYYLAEEAEKARIPQPYVPPEDAEEEEAGITSRRLAHSMASGSSSGRFLSGFVLFAFFVLIYSCLIAKPLRSKKGKGGSILQDFGIDTKNSVKRV